MCWPWLEHVKNTTTLHPSIYSILPSVSPFCPPLPLCTFFPWASLCPFSAWMMKGFTSHVFFIQFLPCWPYFAFFWSHFLCRAPRLIIALLSLITPSCLGEWCRLPGVSPSPSDTVTLAALQSINSLIWLQLKTEERSDLRKALCCLLSWIFTINTQHVCKSLWWIRA